MFGTLCDDCEVAQIMRDALEKVATVVLAVFFRYGASVGKLIPYPCMSSAFRSFQVAIHSNSDGGDDEKQEAGMSVLETKLSSSTLPNVVYRRVMPGE